MKLKLAHLPILPPTQFTGLILCLVPTLHKGKNVVLQLHETALTHSRGIVNKTVFRGHYTCACLQQSSKG